ncbi:hypothetical protein [Sphingomonas sp.]|uniref:hypothetical protein n=1 Tax=Sphingomonas sp. TaxID=28214 RepID=UPI002ED775B5
MPNSWFWRAALTAVIVYCVAQAVRDLRAKRYAWAAAAVIAAALLLIMPVQTHAVKIDLPAASPP